MLLALSRTNDNGKEILIVHMYLPKGLGTGYVSLKELKGTNKQSLVLLNGAEDTMKQSWMEKLLPATEGVTAYYAVGVI
jgi:hypothetical protein